jgi:hypothetical protein
MQHNPELGANLLTFIGTVAWFARDHQSLSWASYEQAFQAKMATNPSHRWGQLDNKLHALCMGSHQP